MPLPLTTARWRSWRPSEYYRDYYSVRVEPDEQEALRFQVGCLVHARRIFPLALEYGCGPTLMRAIAASRYVGRLHVADRLESNLVQVRKWVERHPEADDWHAFTKYVLQCEGVHDPSEEEVAAREDRTRAVLTDFLTTDARQRYPLGREREASYDLLVTGFCVDCISRSKAVWRRCMWNVFSLLKPGGSFVLAVLRACRAYRVGDRWFPGSNIELGELEEVLTRVGCGPADLWLAERYLPSHASQGYSGILLAGGRKLSSRGRRF